MQIRGAPAIGAAAACALALGAQKLTARSQDRQTARHMDYQTGTLDNFFDKLSKIASEIKSSRPTAVNLFWGVERISNFAQKNKNLPLEKLKKLLLNETEKLMEEDVKINKLMGEYGAKFIKNGNNILTHCNAGALATVGFGTALGVVRAAFYQGKKIHVYVDETRPRLQGAKLTAWELKREKIPFTLISDNMAGFLMKQGKINVVITGADRIAKNGDTANKIGTYSLAVLANHHHIPFYIAAPMSTIDLKTPNGDKIIIEERNQKEVTHIEGKEISPSRIKAYNPAFDVTPYKYITAIITESGIWKPKK
jgi:methylthioribose-1-phosphate isomerase